MAEPNFKEQSTMSSFASHYMASTSASYETIDIDSHQRPLTNFFTWLDYTLFCLMLLLSALIGVYFGFFAKRKQNNTVQYLLGGKKMKFFPIAASLIASHVNGYTMLAVPAEVYGYGSEYSLCVISAVLVGVFDLENNHLATTSVCIQLCNNIWNFHFQTGVALIYVYLPVFYDLQLTSSFQYLELRFNRKVRLVASSIYIISGVIMAPTIM